MVLMQTYPTFFNALFILINFDVYNYYFFLFTFIVTYIKNCMTDVSFPVLYAHFFHRPGRVLFFLGHTRYRPLYAPVV